MTRAHLCHQAVQIAQTIVDLGLQLDVVSKATMADAFAVALQRTGQTVAASQSRPQWPAGIAAAPTINPER